MVESRTMSKMIDKAKVRKIQDFHVAQSGWSNDKVAGDNELTTDGKSRTIKDALDGSPRARRKRSLSRIPTATQEYFSVISSVSDSAQQSKNVRCNLSLKDSSTMLDMVVELGKRAKEQIFSEEGEVALDLCLKVEPTK